MQPTVSCNSGGPSFLRFCKFQGCDLVFHFPGTAVSSPVIWSVIFQVLHIPLVQFNSSFPGYCILRYLHYTRLVYSEKNN